MTINKLYEKLVLPKRVNKLYEKLVLKEFNIGDKVSVKISGSMGLLDGVVKDIRGNMFNVEVDGKLRVVKHDDLQKRESLKEKDELTTIDGKKVMLTISGSGRKGTDEAGNNYIKKGSVWVKEAFRIGYQPESEMKEGDLADDLSQRKFGKDFDDLSDDEKNQLESLKEDMRKDIVKLHKKGLTPEQIAKELSKNLSDVKFVLNIKESLKEGADNTIGPFKSKQIAKKAEQEQSSTSTRIWSQGDEWFVDIWYGESLHKRQHENKDFYSRMAENVNPINVFSEGGPGSGQQGHTTAEEPPVGRTKKPADEDDVGGDKNRTTSSKNAPKNYEDIDIVELDDNDVQTGMTVWADDPEGEEGFDKKSKVIKNDFGLLTIEHEDGSKEEIDVRSVRLYDGEGESQTRDDFEKLSQKSFNKPFDDLSAEDLTKVGYFGQEFDEEK